MAAIYGTDGDPAADDADRAGHAQVSPAGAAVPAARSVDVSALHRKHFVHLVRLAAMLVGDRETAEDIVQDVFARMQGHWRRFSDDDRALRYVRASVINGARAALRRRRTAARHRPDPLPDAAPAEHLALARLQDSSVRAAVARLPSRQREVILLRYLEDLPVAETARVLGISSGAVKSSAGRAMASLATLLGASDD